MKLWMEHWRTRAECLGHDPELFFPVGTTGPAADQVDATKQICAGCLVQQACLDWALRSMTEQGIWGGLTGVERREIRPRREGAGRPPLSHRRADPTPSTADTSAHLSP